MGSPINSTKISAEQLSHLLQQLLHMYGPQHWWPADSVSEMLVGAVLVQNTRWENVESSIRNIKDVLGEGIHQPDCLLSLPLLRWEQLIRPSGFMKAKVATCLRLLDWWQDHERLRRLSTAELRSELLALKGIGPETADIVCLFTFERPVFIWSAYARRLLQHMGYSTATQSYEYCRRAIKVDNEQLSAQQCQELHALIVAWGKDPSAPIF